MKLHHYPETDSLYIDLNSRPSADPRVIAEGLVIDFDAQGNIVGIDIDHASQKLDLQTLEAVSLPAPATKLTREAPACPRYQAPFLRIHHSSLLYSPFTIFPYSCLFKSQILHLKSRRAPAPALTPVT